jgi:predicted aldo/keto reductase-like oxidoreductase
MSDMDQVKDNVGFMKEFKPLDEKELQAVWKVRDIFLSKGSIPCTACKYCMDVCPMNIAIPDLFADKNAKSIFNSWGSDFYYGIHTKNNGKASDCIKCGKCEQICPQHLEIRKLLEDVANTFEKEEN